ncbi:hypothetical protein ZIOFF_067478 [Zingiber officinale]|uniref:Nudix hydrolase domain-containing protein n=1 Tax=Zingiber officinale TaxID=94328 RepID=A0A8J5CDE5_ZINOF|nr:hypothetical protein ZIOFF_067478 [Zingiber officinale]
MVRSRGAAKELHLPSFILLDPPASSPLCCSLSGGIASGGEIRFGLAIPAKEMVVSLVSRCGRRLQWYKAGRCLIIGCISFHSFHLHSRLFLWHLEAAIFGGWELDETKAAAASREAFEEAGVTGNFKDHLGRWLSEDRDKIHYMFAMEVTEVSIAEARQVCKHSWMGEALDKFEELL